MNNMYTVLGNLQIIFQIILWLLSFYWLDFELFTYILNDYYFIKIISGLIIMWSQLFLFQYFLYVVQTDSIYEVENDTELQNIQERLDYTICKKCNIARLKRAHHCRYCNKCVLKMDHHCFSLNKCIGENNYNYFIKYIIMIELNSSYIFWIGIYVLFNYYSEIKLFGCIKYGVLVFVSFMESCGLFFYLLFHVYLNLVDLTTLEVIYPNLRVKPKK